MSTAVRREVEPMPVRDEQGRLPELGAHRLLVLAPHPDDEVIGCGGLISRIKEAGGEVFVQMMVVGDTTDVSARGRSSAAERDTEVARVAELLGFDGVEVVFRGDHHLRLDTLPQASLIDAIESSGTCAIERVRPTLVALPDPDSYNQDHRAVANAAISVLRPGDGRLRHRPTGALVYEQVADQWTAAVQGVPNVAVELAERHLDAKIEAMRTYKSQVRDHPSTRSPQALRAMATYRGGQFGCARAEAYRALRWLL